jgi:hypothetical protein
MIIIVLLQVITKSNLLQVIIIVLLQVITKSYLLQVMIIVLFIADDHYCIVAGDDYRIVCRR